MKNMKFDPTAWVEGKANEAVPCGRIAQVRLAKPGALEYNQGDGWRLVGHGDEFRVTFPQGGQVRSPDARIAVYAGLDASVPVTEAPFTNLEKKPGLSSAERIVRTTMREYEVARALAAEKRRRGNFQQMEKLKNDGVIEDHDVPDPDYVPPKDPAPVEPAADEAATS